MVCGCCSPGSTTRASVVSRVAGRSSSGRTSGRRRSRVRRGRAACRSRRAGYRGLALIGSEHVGAGDRQHESAPRRSRVGAHPTRRARGRAPRRRSPPAPPRWRRGSPCRPRRDRARSWPADMKVFNPDRCAASSLSLTPPMGKHLATQGDLAGHREVSADAAAGRDRHHRGRHGHARRRTILGNRARRDVHVDGMRVEEITWRAVLDGVDLRPRQRGLRGLLHHAAELSGEHEVGLGSRWRALRR